MAQAGEGERRPIRSHSMSRLHRFIRRLLPWMLGFTVFVFSFGTSQQSPLATMRGDDAMWMPETLVTVAALSGLAALLVRRLRWPLFGMAAVGWLTFSMWPACMVAAYYAALTLKRRRDTLAFLSVAAAMIAVPIMIGSAAGYSGSSWGVFLGVIAVALLIGLPYTFGLWVRARREVLAGLHERAERLEREQATRAEQARTEERARIAREMHDVVAHRVSLMVLHAGALEVNASDPAFAQEAALIRVTGREALTELRQVLGVLRRGVGAEGTPVVDEQVYAPQPVLTDLDRLLAQSRAAGLAVQRVDEGERRELPPTVERTAYRVVQEALTNVAKHAGGAPTSVTLRHLPGALELIVANRPPSGRVEPMPGSGLGLIGLRERVELLHGRLDASPRLDGGFILRVWLPAHVTEAAA